MTVTCETCRFFHPSPDRDDVPGFGDCRRRPPAVLDFARPAGVWPTVDVDAWCGEWEWQEREPW